MELRRIDVSAFFQNPSYFGIDRRGRRYAFRGHHPTLVHWPLGEYAGGTQLLRSIYHHVSVFEDLAGPRAITWIDAANWHSTVFSPVHSSNPKVIATTTTDVINAVRTAVRATPPYTLTFQNLTVTATGGILAVGAAVPALTILRHTLKQMVPHGHASSWVHITVGQITRNLTRSREERLLESVAAGANQEQVLGSLDVRFLTYANYVAPFLKMHIQELSRIALKGL